MQFRWLVIVGAAIAVAAADPALAQSRKKGQPRCNGGAYQFSLSGLLFNPKPGPNGCAPPVYAYGQYVGQDPDPNIRFQLRRDPATGYTTEFAQ